MKIRLALIALLAVAAILFMGAQRGEQAILTQIVAAGGGGTWTVAQLKYNDNAGGGTGGSSCATGQTTCTVTVASIVAGHPVISFDLLGNGSSLTMSAVNGETWINCGPCSGGNAGDGWTNAKHVISATGGETSFTCTASASPSGYNSCGILELVWSGSTVAFDTANNAHDALCTTCAGIALTLTGTNDAIFQFGVPVNLLTAITGPYSTNAHFYSGSGEAVALNQSSGTAPNWTQNSSGTVSVAAIALKGN